MDGDQMDAVVSGGLRLSGQRDGWGSIGCVLWTVGVEEGASGERIHEENIGGE
jgi:hypothetical protein